MRLLQQGTDSLTRRRRGRKGRLRPRFGLPPFGLRARLKKPVPYSFFANFSGPTPQTGHF